MRPIIRIFSAAGQELGSAVWDKGRIIEWGWSSDLELVVVEEGGKVGGSRNAAGGVGPRVSLLCSFSSGLV